MRQNASTALSTSGGRVEGQKGGRDGRDGRGGKAEE